MVYKVLRKDATGIAPLKDNGCLFNAFKDNADSLSWQYQSVYTKEDQDSPVPEPYGNPYSQMEEISVNEGVEKLLCSSNP